MTRATTSSGSPSTNPSPNKSGETTTSEGSTTSKKTRRSIRSLWKLLIVALLLVGVGILIVAALVGDGRDDANDLSVISNPAINQLIPARGDEVLQQNRVGVDLDARYLLTKLVIDGIDVTAEVVHTSGLNLWEFSPGEGRLIERLSPDTNCATATYARIAQPADTDTISWCFQVS